MAAALAAAGRRRPSAGGVGDRPRPLAGRGPRDAARGAAGGRSCQVPRAARRDVVAAVARRRLDDHRGRARRVPPAAHLGRAGRASTGMLIGAAEPGGSGPGDRARPGARPGARRDERPRGRGCRRRLAGGAAPGAAARGHGSRPVDRDRRRRRRTRSTRCSASSRAATCCGRCASGPRSRPARPRGRARRAAGRRCPGWRGCGTPCASAADGQDGVYLVGGAVRDVLLGEPTLRHRPRGRGRRRRVRPRDWPRGWTAGCTCTRSSTRRWCWRADMRVDVATARTEHYEHPAALPVVEHASIRQDLHRRDFTINAMAVDAVGRRVRPSWSTRSAAPSDLAAGRAAGAPQPVVHRGSDPDLPGRAVREPLRLRDGSPRPASWPGRASRWGWSATCLGRPRARRAGRAAVRGPGRRRRPPAVRARAGRRRCIRRWTAGEAAAGLIGRSTRSRRPACAGRSASGRPRLAAMAAPAPRRRAGRAGWSGCGSAAATHGWCGDGRGRRAAAGRAGWRQPRSRPRSASCWTPSRSRWRSAVAASDDGRAAAAAELYLEQLRAMRLDLDGNDAARRAGARGVAAGGRDPGRAAAAAPQRRLGGRAAQLAAARELAAEVPS